MASRFAGLPTTGLFCHRAASNPAWCPGLETPPVAYWAGTCDEKRAFCPMYAPCQCVWKPVAGTAQSYSASFGKFASLRWKLVECGTQGPKFHELHSYASKRAPVLCHSLSRSAGPCRRDPVQDQWNKVLFLGLQQRRASIQQGPTTALHWPQAHKQRSAACFKALTHRPQSTYKALGLQHAAHRAHRRPQCLAARRRGCWQTTPAWK